MKTLFMTLGFIKTIIGFLRDIKKKGADRLSKKSAKKDRERLEDIAVALREGDIKSLPKWCGIRLVCKWLKRLGLLGSIGTYLQTVLKSGYMDSDNQVLYRTQ